MIEIIEAALTEPEHAAALIRLMDEYAHDPMGGGTGLSDYAKEHLVTALGKRHNAHVILALIDSTAVGLMICFEGFSTFACKPLLNIHDVIVSKDYRGQGLSKLMLEKAEAIARTLDCCKLTLEVLEGNHTAQAAYRAAGFAAYELDPAMGKALFWQKTL
jgi:ribosomal protein S18 acetylase RimI-like enzyme